MGLRAAVGQFTSREVSPSGHPHGAGQNGCLEVYKTKESKFMAEKKKPSV